MAPTMQRTLAVLLAQPDRSWYLRDLASSLGLQPSTLQRPLAALARAGIIRRRKDGNRVYYRADRENPFFSELQGLILKTVGLVEPLRDALKRFTRQIDLAFIHGSVASGAEKPSSDVDLVVIGRVGLADLAPALRRAEARVGRPVNVTLLTPAEFATRYRDGGPFALGLMRSEKIFIQGTELDLARVAGRRAR